MWTIKTADLPAGPGSGASLYQQCYNEAALIYISYSLYLLHFIWKQGKSEGFDSCDRPSNLKLDSNRQFFRLCDREILWMTLKNNRTLLYYVKHHFKSIGEFKLDLQSRNAQLGSKFGDILSCVTLKFDGWPWKTIGHLFYATSSFVHAAFRSHWWIRTEVTVRKRPIWVKFDDF